MKKILGIVTSNRKLGNCELMIREIHHNITTSHNLELLRLPEFDIKPCKGCYKCLFNEQKCIINDDMYAVLKAITAADALILAAPTYFLGAHSSLKTFIDRGLSFYKYIDQLWGKPSIGIALAGIKGKEGSTLLGINNFLKFVLSDIKQTQIAYGALPGEAILDIENKKIAQILAKNLFKKTIQKKTTNCNLCGGDTFRFMGDNKIKCMLCSNSGTTKLNSKGKVSVSINKENHQLFLTKEDALKHKDWLIGMKNNYKIIHKELKNTIKNYQEEIEWIHP